MDRKHIVDKYDAYYKKDPSKWADNKRNAFAFNTLNTHIGIEPQEIIDVGCGNGHTLEYFHGFWKTPKYYGLDLSPEAVRLAHKRIPEADIRLGWLEDHPFGKKQFDVVILLGVMEHFEDLLPSLRLVKELISPGGICYTEIPNCISYPKSVHTEGFRELASNNHQYEWHLFRPTWEKKFLEAGFNIVGAFTGPSIYTEFVWLLT